MMIAVVAAFMTIGLYNFFVGGMDNVGSIFLSAVHT